MIKTFGIRVLTINTRITVVSIQLALPEVVLRFFQYMSTGVINYGILHLILLLHCISSSNHHVLLFYLSSFQ